MKSEKRDRFMLQPNPDDLEMLSGVHNWNACSHARPTYCNVCREALSGVTSHGLSCEGDNKCSKIQNIFTACSMALYVSRHRVKFTLLKIDHNLT